jgi:AraC family transcriptional regulator
MEPKIITKPAFTVVGMHYRGRNEQNEIPQLWQALGPRSQEIENLAQTHAAYGIMYGYDESSGEFDYLAAMEVKTASNVPEGMISLEVPKQTYAVFTCTLPTIGQAFEHINHTWLPQSGYQRAGGPEFEYYDKRFDIQKPESEMDLYIPIEELG